MKLDISKLFFILFAVCVYSQNQKKKDTVYIRYNGDIVNDYRFNTIKLYELINDSTYFVKEIYRFTEKPQLKSVHYENINREKNGYYKYYNTKGYLESEGNFINDEADGLWKFYNQDGSIKYEMPYVLGKKEGEATYYKKSGLQYSINWINDEPNGEVVKYDDEGNLIFKGFYSEGKLNGTNIWYFNNGKIKREEDYKVGKLNGDVRSYYDNGNLRSKGSTIEGEKVGEWFWYYENGDLSSEEIYNVKGKLKRAKFYDENCDISNGKRNLTEGVIEERRALNRKIKNYVRKNFSYPETMYKKGFEGRVYVTFKVNKKGEITEIKAKGEAHQTLIEKAKSIIASLPNQTPAKYHNQEIEVPFSLPMVFQIQD